MTASKKRNLLLATLAIALPVAGQRLIDIAVNMADTIMLGYYGDITLSASSLANQFYNIFAFLCMGISGGCNVLASQYWGAGDKAGYRSVITLALRISGASALVFMVISAFFPQAVMQMYSNDAAVIAAGVKYLRITVWIYLIHGVTTCMAMLLRSASMAWLPFLMSCVSLVTNIFCNWVLIFGKFGFPELQIEGAALGTLIARLIEFSVIFGYLLFKDKKIGYTLGELKKKIPPELLRTFIKTGTPVIISDTLYAFGNSMVAMVVGKVGVEMSAANSICTMVIQVATAVLSGIGMAGSVVVGQSIGRGDKKEAQRLGLVYLGLAVGIGVFGIAIILTIAPFVISMYNISDLTRAYAHQLMYSFAFVVVFQSISSVLAKGVLRGGGDTRFLMVADVIFLWIASVPLGYAAAFVWHMSPFWIQLFLKIDLILKSFLCIGRLLSGKWIRKLTRKEVEQA